MKSLGKMELQMVFIYFVEIVSLLLESISAGIMTDGITSVWASNKQRLFRLTWSSQLDIVT